jgi:esterase/lipase superfamily enzyme
MASYSQRCVMTKTPFFMVTNRNVAKDGLTDKRVDTLSYFTSKAGVDLTKFDNWTPLKGEEFVKALRAQASTFPLLPDERNTEQKHVSLFVHGYNADWSDSATRYMQIKKDLYDAADLGVLVLFSWPSNGSTAAYLPDREDARDSGPQTAELFVRLHEIVAAEQRLAATTNDPTKMCRAKISVIAHSMGNYVVQKGLAVAAKRLNSPQLITLVHQLAMVAADVDNDLFQTDRPSEDDGSLMSNLCYRIGALYTGLDDVLGASAGLKHFGKRRLGRSGLSDPNNTWDNVFHQDVSDLIIKKNIHSAVFDSPKSLALLEKVLRGVDRKHL